jgi:hypothetical protein
MLTQGKQQQGDEEEEEVVVGAGSGHRGQPQTSLT